MIEGFMPPPNFVSVEDLSERIPEEHRDKLKNVNWKDVNFTTFSICHTTFLEYEITSDGDIYAREDNLLEKLDYTGEIEFYTLITQSDSDFELCFKATFYKGELKHFSLEKLKEIDQAPRKEAQAKVMQVVKEQEALKKKWWYKLFSLYRDIMSFLFTCVRWVCAAVIKTCWFIQTKIT